MNDDRITAFAQSVYYTRHNEMNSVTGNDLVDFQNAAIESINQFKIEIEKEADWLWLRTNDNTSIGTITSGTTVSYALPSSIRKLVINPKRDLTIRQDGTVVSTFKLVNPNQSYDPTDTDTRSRATVMRRKIIFSRPLTDIEVSGTIVADTIDYIPELSHQNGDLLDIFDEYPDVRQLFVMGVVKNQVLSDIVQGGLAPAFTTKYTSLLKDAIAENNASADADSADREDFSFIRGVGYN